MATTDDTQSASADALISYSIKMERELLAVNLAAAIFITVTSTSECRTNARITMKNDFDVKVNLARRHGQTVTEIHSKPITDQMTIYSMLGANLCKVPSIRDGAADNAANIERYRRYREAS